MSSDSPLSIGLRSARALALPAVLLLSAGTVLVISYYQVPGVTRTLSHVAHMKAQSGCLFAPFATLLLAGFIPWVFRMSITSLRPTHPVRELLFSLGWWAFMGTVIDCFYRLLGVAFDATGWHPALIVLCKVLCDMLIFTTVFASPANAIAHLWKDMAFSSEKLRSALRPGWYRRIVFPNLVPNFMLWFPGVTLVYSMPPDLQLPMSNLIGCFWSLMCVQIAANSRGRMVVVSEGVG